MHPTFIIAAFTGDASHSITVGIISVPSDEESWSDRLRIYFKALIQHNTRKKDTPLGALMVTNLSGFPSSLTIIPIPDGNVSAHRKDFFVNENLKRLGCAGRTGISVAEPTLAAQAKFHQLYKTSDKVGLYESVIEMVKLCQIALMLFGVLDSVFIDGLLCDVTERAAQQWWIEFGVDFYNVQPNDGVLGPTTVAALLGSLIGVRNRLHALGVPVSKDAFDVQATKRGIASFQKSHKISPRTRRVDRNTLNRLYKLTAKQATAESWAVPRAVKSTVAELSGKGGEMVMDIVGSRDKTSLADIETADIERFALLVKGENAKWLWLGKPRKRTTRELFEETPGQVLQAQVDIELAEDHEHTLDPDREVPPADSPEKHKHRFRPQKRPSKETEKPRDEGTIPHEKKRTVLGRATGRLRGAVGRRGDQPDQRNKDGLPSSPAAARGNSLHSSSEEEPTSSRPASSYRAEHSSKEHITPQGSPAKADSRIRLPQFARHFVDTPHDTHFPFSAIHSSHESSSPSSASSPRSSLDEKTTRRLRNQFATADITAQETNLSDTDFLTDDRPGQDISLLLRRTRSFSHHESDALELRNENYWPRNLSFSAAEDVVLPCPAGVNDTAEIPDDERGDKPPTQANALSAQLHRTQTLQAQRSTLAHLGATLGAFLTRQLTTVTSLDDLAQKDLTQLNSLYEPRSSEHRTLAETSKEALAEERSRMQGAVRDVETLQARLEYEMGVLRGKVDDVEDAVREFEKSVVYTEGRVGELVRGSEGRGGWSSWFGGAGGRSGVKSEGEGGK